MEIPILPETDDNLIVENLLNQLNLGTVNSETPEYSRESEINARKDWRGIQ